MRFRTIALIRYEFSLFLECFTEVEQNCLVTFAKGIVDTEIGI